MARKPTRTALRNKADRLWSQFIRSKGKCEKCGTDRTLQAAHIVSRRYSNTRHDPRNGLALCSKCHFWAHQFPTAFSRFAEEARGRETIEELELVAQSTVKPDYELAIDTLKNVMEEAA